MKLSEKEQAIVLDAFETLSKHCELTEDERGLIQRLNKANPNYKLALDTIVENNYRKENYYLKLCINEMLKDHSIKITELLDKQGIRYHANYKGNRSDAHSYKHKAILQSLKASS